MRRSQACRRASDRPPNRSLPSETVLSAHVHEAKAGISHRTWTRPCMCASCHPVMAQTKPQRAAVLCSRDPAAPCRQWHNRWRIGKLPCYDGAACAGPECKAVRDHSPDSGPSARSVGGIVTSTEHACECLRASPPSSVNLVLFQRLPLQRQCATLGGSFLAFNIFSWSQ